MKTHPIIDETHLTQADLDRAASPEEAASLTLGCHQEDCFVHGSELDAFLHETTPVTKTPPSSRQP